MKRFIVPFLLIFVIIGCAKTQDRYILGDENCNPPCWMGIKPGETSINEARKILERLENEKLTINQSEFGLNGKIDDRFYSIYAIDNIAEVVNLSLSRKTKTRDLLAIFGEPSYAVISDINHGYFIAQLLYPDEGIVLLLSSSAVGFEVNPRDPVIKVQFVRPTDIESLANLLYGHILYADMDSVKEWRGYGSIDE